MEVKVSKGKRGSGRGSDFSNMGNQKQPFDVFTAKPAGVSDLIVALAIKTRSMAGFGNPVRGSENS